MVSIAPLLQTIPERRRQAQEVREPKKKGKDQPATSAAHEADEVDDEGFTTQYSFQQLWLLHMKHCGLKVRRKHRMKALAARS